MNRGTSDGEESRDPPTGDLSGRLVPGVEEARQALGAARSVLVLTGAGISAESGVPTFRGEDGLWRRFRPEELATPHAFDRDPCLVWEWYAERRERVAACAPNPAHLALARWSLRRKGVRIVTQNVDDLHSRAAVLAESGTGEGGPRSGVTLRNDPRENPARPVELHGSLFRVRCTACGCRLEHRDPVDASSVATLPHCPDCGALLRPDVVWFGEPLPADAVARAFGAAARADACLVVGTSAIVHPAAGLATTVHGRGGIVVEVNPEETPLTALATVSLRARAVAVVPPMLAAGAEDPR